jgi:NADH dehydrogenase
LFITGASGFIGQRFLAALSRAGGDLRAVCLSRGAQQGSAAGNGGEIRWVRGGLEDAERFEHEMGGVHAVVHLAAATGKAHRATHLRVNVDGTRALLECARRAGVERFLFVSSIVVRYAQRARYHYAEAKELAEALVRLSGLRCSIARPTIVAGHGSPVMEGLARLASLPVVPVFGNGATRVQPIHVDDLAVFLLDIVREDRFSGEVFEFGGPQILSIEKLLGRLCRARLGREPRVLHVPFGLVVPALGLLEAVLGPGRMPVTPGQLSLFRNDGTIQPNELYERRRSSLKSLDEMLAPGTNP